MATYVSWAQHLETKNIAYGYSSSCPVSAVGWNATAAVQWAAGIGTGGIELAMKASNESDTYSWKRFDFAASLVINYNSVPTASAPTVLTPGLGCAATEAAAVGFDGKTSITFRANISDPDGNVYNRLYLEKKGSGSTWVNEFPSAGYLQSAAPAASGLQSATLTHSPSSPMAAGTYRFAFTGFDGTLESPKTSWCYFIVDPNVPPTPTVTSVSAGPYAVGVGIEVEVVTSISDPDDFVKTFALLWSPGTVAPVLPSYVSAPSKVNCMNRGDATTAVMFACIDHPTDSGELITAPVSPNYSLWVATYNSAGVPSAPVAVTLTGSIDPNPSVSFGSAANGWSPIMDGVPGTWGGSIPTLATHLDGVDLTVSGYAPTAELEYESTLYPTLNFNSLVPVQTITPAGTSTPYVPKELGWDSTATITVLGWAEAPTTSAPATGRVRLCTAGSNNSGAVLVATTCAISGASFAVADLWAASSGVPAGYTSAAVVTCKAFGNARTPTLRAGSSCPSGQTVVATAYVAAPASAPSATAGTGMIDPRDSFSIAAIVRPETGYAGGVLKEQVIISQDGTVGPSFRLGLNGSKQWMFCLGTSTVTPPSWSYTPRCKTISGVPLEEATLVIAVWDAVNRQVRIYIGSGSDPAFVGTDTGYVSEAPLSTGLLRVGAERQRGALVNPWLGDISFVSITPGIYDDSQFTDLAAAGLTGGP